MSGETSNKNDVDRKSAAVESAAVMSVASNTNSETVKVKENEQWSAPPDIPASMLCRHPLQYNWVLWYCRHDRTKEWKDCLKQVTLFNTVEDFWALYNHIQTASNMHWNSDYYVFKEGIQPEWEDPQNQAGGRWLIKVDRTRRGLILDHYWLELLMCMVGEQFEDLGDAVCGAVVNVRNKGDKVSLWTRDANQEATNRRIGEIIKQKLSLLETIVYEVHKDTASKVSSTVVPEEWIEAERV